MTAAPGGNGSARAPWNLRLFAGWPGGIPFDRELARAIDRCFRDADIVREIGRRVAAHGLGSIVVTMVVGFGGGTLLLGLLAVPALLVDLAWIVALPVVGLPAGVATVAVALRRWSVPRRRAAMRGLGLDVCVRCGQVIEGATDAGACPECDERHDDLPLGWIESFAESTTESS